MLSDEDKQWFSAKLDRLFVEREQPFPGIEEWFPATEKRLAELEESTLKRLDLCETRLIEGFRNAVPVFEAELLQQELQVQRIKGELELLNGRVTKLEDECRAS